MIWISCRYYCGCTFKNCVGISCHFGNETSRRTVKLHLSHFMQYLVIQKQRVGFCGSVGRLADCRLNNRVSIPCRRRDISALLSDFPLQRTVHFSMSAGVSFRVAKLKTGTYLLLNLRMRGILPPVPHAPLWHGYKASGLLFCSSLGWSKRHCPVNVSVSWDWGRCFVFLLLLYK